MISESFMFGWGWVLLSLVAAMFSALMFALNQYMKQPGHVLVFWMRVLIVLCLTPVVAQIPWPTDWHFYVSVILAMLTGTTADIRIFNVSAKYGGGVVARLQPLIVWGSFLVWFLFDPKIIYVYLQHPLNTAGILLAMAGCVYFAVRMSHCSISRRAFVEVLPALLGYMMSTVLNKYAMEHGSALSTVFWYMYVQSFLAVILIGGFTVFLERRQPKSAPSWINGKMALAAFLMMIGWIGHMVPKNYAMVYTPNPSYQAALNLTAPVFIAIYYALTGHKEEADVKSGMGVVACAMLLALLTVH